MEHSNGRSAKESAADGLAELQLLHLADSALPIGSLAHSFGLEALVAEELLDVARLPEFFEVYLCEAGLVEAVFCREAWRIGNVAAEAFSPNEWLDLNEKLSARKPSRESRAASAALGQHFMMAVNGLGDFPMIAQAFHASQRSRSMIHHSTAFGLAGGALGFASGSVVAAFLHQSLAGLISACQRLMPFGQREATRLLWKLKPAILQTSARSELRTVDDVASFTPLVDWGAMEHPVLVTRLFIS
ncbi:MAG TPA: urease accessory UreF family protein [Candidatus Acidoferrales bacterium]